MPRLLVLTGLFSSLVFGAASARASDLAGGTLRVTRSETAADCPDDITLQSSTLALGTVPPAPSSDPLNVDIDFERDEDGYVARIRTSGRSEGVREVRKPGNTCAPLAEAVSVVLAVVFDLLPPEPGPQAPGPEAPPEPTPVAPPPAKPAPPLPPPERARETRPGTEFSFGVAAQGGLAYGLLGDALVGAVSLGVRPRFGRFDIGIGGLWAPNRTIEYLDGTVSVSVWSARIGACGWLNPSVLKPDLAACLGFLVGSLNGSGEDFDEPGNASDLWLAFEAGAAGRVPLARNWALRLGISALIPTRQQSFEIRGGGTAFESSPAAVLLELGPEWRFR